MLCTATVAAISRAADDANLRDFLDAAPASRLDMEVSDAAVVENLNRPEDYEAASRERAKGS